MSTEKEKLQELVEDLRADKQRLQGKFDKLVGQPTDALDKREALELSRSMQISELEKGLKESD